MTSGLLLAMTLPGLVLLLLALVVVEQVLSRLGRRSPVAGEPRASLSATGFDVFAVLVAPNKEAELEQRGQDKVRRLNQEDSPPAPNSVDLRTGVARLRLPRT